MTSALTSTTSTVRDRKTTKTILSPSMPTTSAGLYSTTATATTTHHQGLCKVLLPTASTTAANPVANARDNGHPMLPGPITKSAQTDAQ